MVVLKRCFLKVSILFLLFFTFSQNAICYEITISDEAKKNPQTTSFLETLKEALAHPNFKDRNLPNIFVLNPKETFSDPTYFYIFVNPQWSTRDLVDVLIQAAKPKDTHPSLLPIVRIHGNQGVQATGFFLDDEGFIVTNAHFVQENTVFIIEVLNKNNELQAPIFYAVPVARDDFTDLGLIRLVESEKINFLVLYDTLPHISLDHREWAYEKIYSNQSLKIVGFPGYAQSNPTLRDGILEKSFINQWSIQNHQVRFQTGPGFSGSPAFSDEGYVIGINYLGVRLNEQRISDTALIIDFQSAYHILKQLKEFQKVKTDLFIQKKENGFQVFERPRPFEYTHLWTAGSHMALLTFDHIVFANAYGRTQSGEIINCGVGVYQNPSFRPTSFSQNAFVPPQNNFIQSTGIFSPYRHLWAPKITLLTSFNHEDLSASEGYESSLKKFSWLLRDPFTSTPSMEWTRRPE